MKKSETGFITRIVTLIMVCVMALSLIPNVSANAATTSKSTAYKSTKTMTCYLAGRERKTITMPADIAKISFGSQSAVKMRKASSRKVVVSGIRNGKTKFTVITKDKRRIVCNVVRTTKFTMSPSKKRVINTNIKLKYVKSSNTKLATVKLVKNKKSFTVTTKKKGTVKITVRYSNNKVETLRLVVAHQHTWKTVVDKNEWDEPIYEEQDVYENHSIWPDGSYADELSDSCAKQRWCADHCISCFPDCPDPDPAGRCALSITWGSFYVRTDQVQTGTRHHDAITHKECSVCGARQ
ncbi:MULTISPECIES: hypothetical protein [Coprococcus]|uniref:Bacterial Ig-like domain (Group 2) n=1 Tax=Coprococcus eutactus TaxID=33043 RepID=A0AAI9K2Q4_9FIRM|nr:MULTISPECIES: hypothetical protein [Coprococcus]MCU6721489.1 hypothetical protein [Coprococcus aceti]GFO93006.1 hypothetical protein COEU31_00520 [Coprococcus eutactus]CUN55281.1 Flp pilus assembly protein%2C secretin CpaC [Coprococcus eutactus]